jgi:hypothetical protein
VGQQRGSCGPGIFQAVSWGTSQCSFLTNFSFHLHEREFVAVLDFYGRRVILFQPWYIAIIDCLEWCLSKGKGSSVAWILRLSKHMLFLASVG